MIKCEVFAYDVWGNDECGYGVNEIMPTGIIIYTDTSRSSLCAKLDLDNPYKIDALYSDNAIYINYRDKPYCELREVD